VVARRGEVPQFVAAAVRGVDKMVSDGREPLASGQLDRARRSVRQDLSADPVALRRAARARPCRGARALRARAFAGGAPAVPGVAGNERRAAGCAAAEDSSRHQRSSGATSRLRRFLSGERGRSAAGRLARRAGRNDESPP